MHVVATLDAKYSLGSPADEPPEDNKAKLAQPAL